MSLSAEKYRQKLITEILMASTEEEGFNPRTKNVQQWSNIQTARSYIGIIKQRLSTLLH